MTPDPLNESLSKLDDKYQILTELHHCGESRTYLARHLELNRDVTITVDLSAGPHAATVRTTDLTAAYVHENSAYST